MVWLTLIIGLINVCIGYAVAVRLGYGPPGLVESWEAMTVDPPEPNRKPRHKKTPASEAEQSWVEEEPVEEEPIAEDTVEEEPVAEEQIAEVPEEDSGEMEMLDDQFVEASVLNFKVAMIKSGLTLANIDTELRACGGEFDEELIRETEHLEADCSAYMIEQEVAAARFSDRIGELGELSAMGEDIEMTILEETVQIETTISNLTHMDFDSDLNEAGRRLLEEVDNLRTARHKLQDSLDAAFVAIARHEGRLDTVEERMTRDPLTKLPNRIGMEVEFDRWWKDSKHKKHELNAVLYYLDTLGEIDEKQGSICGDRVLIQLARLVRQQCGEDDIVARFAGQRIFVLLKDLGPRAAAKKIETIRTLIEQTVFVWNGVDVGMTLTGGATAVAPTDSPELLVERLEKTLRAARRTATNHCYFHDGKNAEPLHFPGINVEGEVISIA